MLKTGAVRKRRRLRRFLNWASPVITLCNGKKLAEISNEKFEEALTKPGMPSTAGLLLAGPQDAAGVGFHWGALPPLKALPVAFAFRTAGRLFCHALMALSYCLSLRQKLFLASPRSAESQRAGL